MKETVRIGVLFSRSGDYETVANASYEGAMAGIEAINADAERSFRFEAHIRDPQGHIERYGSLCSELLRIDALNHIIGCTTSWSRKEVIPVLERYDGLLWYACPYEGFEASDRVIYTHACPNQHVVPLLAYVLPRWGKDAFLVGSNYIWGWEVNRVARDLISEAKGTILGERYRSIGDVDVKRLIAEIQTLRPSFILNNLIGQSSYAFIRAYAALGRQDERFAPSNCPVISCNLTEPDLTELGSASEGLLSVGPYFVFDESSSEVCPSSEHAAAYASVVMLADTIERSGSTNVEIVRQVVAEMTFVTPLGTLTVDRQTQHTALPVQIGRVEGGGFKSVWESGIPYSPDPYLSRQAPRPAGAGSRLRLVT